MCVPFTSGVFTSGKATHNALYVYATIKFSRFFIFRFLFNLFYCTISWGTAV